VSERIILRHKPDGSSPGEVEEVNKFAYRRLKGHPSIQKIELWTPCIHVFLKPGVEKTPQLIKELHRKLGWMLRGSYTLS
jgi:hypothetical protein